MNITGTLHPPGGACAIIAITNKTAINLGYAYILTNLGAALITLVVAIIGNNLIYSRQYPLYWFY